MTSLKEEKKREWHQERKDLSFFDVRREKRMQATLQRQLYLSSPECLFNHSDLSSDSESEIEEPQPKIMKKEISIPIEKIKQTELDDEKFWKEKQPNSEVLIGPKPLPQKVLIGPQPPQYDISIKDSKYNMGFFRGEGEAMASYVQKGKRIPRRGEIGWHSEAIQKFENLGYVMSGSRHHVMNAVRLKKENEVINEEEKKELVKLKYQEKSKRENAIISGFREIIQEKLKKKDL